MKDAIDLLNRRIAELEAENERLRRNYHWLLDREGLMNEEIEHAIFSWREKESREKESD